ncbi:UDP-N-acetylmuramate: L-alanyl-gamma-D-glutamyl-meso-diaminopimelate ligase [Sulfurivirga caldicuralii]|uniref:UDP-N-acetylmuramate--L-alanyl-gamma-D-glutamyl-meso-2,6-diaminoheptandioate ligase n=1 Tax=Sulfurivirga caldicuralii TaxID=364032 RepID=A0A1N6EX66_9GAMM|nr:UDP-N-acetylmuramate:L-alanyl-gamma-D-glutamyl-meso-diaminopimelate ligase [Sulfurivirga caldicuralii]SIN87600.1 UDP-N-acetylmuramate: L-alanyl-gamma-D-glutamyl-meso-diaminopimelate ligase [Sulfurivirga caldicuralii]
MRIHILGVGGTFMGGLAQILQGLGHRVTGSDGPLYPPMSDQLAQAGIEVFGYGEHGWMSPEPDVVVIGNALSRGHVDVEAVLNRGLRYTSGPQILSELLLQDRWVVGIAGTHGKTTTSSMVAWILEYAGLAPGFLIGGVPENFGRSAQVGQAPFFVIEADEYDTAFFDKRSKFVHYRPRTCVINNLEFDHADIFADLQAIQWQFHQLVRTVPGNGLIITPANEPAIDETLAMGCWTPVVRWDERLQVMPLAEAGWEFAVLDRGQQVGVVRWPLTGEHNLANAAAALLAAEHAGVPLPLGVEALNHFKGVRRRQTQVGETAGVRIIDDFAHHPTAIATTLAGLKATLQPGQRLLAVFEPRSNTMRMGVHAARLPEAFAPADAVFAFIDPAWAWQLPPFAVPLATAPDYDTLLKQLLDAVQVGDVVVFMSNGAFGGLQQAFLQALREREKSKG